MATEDFASRLRFQMHVALRSPWIRIGIGIHFRTVLNLTLWTPESNEREPITLG